MDLAAWFQELRRRRVIRALLAWGLFSFAVLQIVEPVQHALGLAEWALRVVVAVVALGFPVTSGLAWAFDLTRRGIERTAPPEGKEAAGSARRAGAGPAVALVAVGALLGAGVAGLAGWHLWGRSPAPGPDGRITVAVADFANETKDPDLDGLSGLLITSLEQSKRLHVLTRSRMFDLLRQVGREDVARIDEPLAREVGRRAGAHALLLASVRKLDDVYSVEMRALDPARDEYLFTVREQATAKKGLLEVVDRLADRTRRSFRESEAEVLAADDKVAETVTASLEAHRHYFQGLQLLDGYQQHGGERELKAALTIDPRFALARLQLLMGGFRVQRPLAQHRELVVTLLGQLDRLPESDRLVVRAEQAILDGQVDHGFALYARAEAARPDDKRILVRMAYLQLYLRGDADAAVRLAERAVALDPPWAPAHDALAASLVTRGDLARAGELARSWAERWPSWLAYAIEVGALLHAGNSQGALVAAQRASAQAEVEQPGSAGWDLARAYIQLGDFDAAEQAARRGWGKGHVGSRVILASILRFRGQRRASAQVLGEDERSGDQAASRARALLAVGDGDPAQVLALARQAGPDLAPGDLAGPLAMAGHATAAEEWLREEPALAAFNARIPPGAARQIAEAVRARDARDFAGARRILEMLRAGQNRPVARQAAYVLGETCLLAGDDACAAEALAGYTPFHWMYETTAWSWPKSLYMLSLAEERMGRRDEARAHAERLMSLWKDADPDLPLLAETRALCKRLGCRPPEAKMPQ